MTRLAAADCLRPVQHRLGSDGGGLASWTCAAHHGSGVVSSLWTGHRNIVAAGSFSAARPLLRLPAARPPAPRSLTRGVPVPRRSFVSLRFLPARFPPLTARRPASSAAPWNSSRHAWPALVDAIFATLLLCRPPSAEQSHNRPREADARADDTPSTCL